MIPDESLSPALLAQAVPVLARGGVSLEGAAAPVGTTRRLVLFDGLLRAEHAALLARDIPALMLALRESSGMPSAWEAGVLGALLRGASLLPEGAEVTRHSLRRVAEIGVVAAAAAVAVGEAGGSRNAAALAADVVHELAANALLDAPAGEDGRARYAHRRTEVQEVAPEDACELAYATQGGRIWLEAVDRFGRLTPAPYVRALQGWGGKVRVDSAGGGAGLGLRRILEHSDLVAVRVVAGLQSRVVSVVDLGESRRRASRPKSLLFSQESR
ncbi:hypothetical protein DRW03_24280 [Corallococcus sp. H22C18031201]|nr:hypothetical protein [Citreicoccus inhibens]RJS18849.1 hypothetical protein DRW03_24280 [Corallococcus sp. H22C18031201]